MKVAIFTGATHCRRSSHRADGRPERRPLRKRPTTWRSK
jgi:hypothetical protein